MHVFIIAAISADGFISRYDEHSSISWRSKEDGQFFIQKTKEAGALVMGATTFGTMRRPMPGRKHYVLTRDPSKFAEYDKSVVEAVTLTPAEIVKKAEDDGYTQLAVCGGSSVYAQFSKAGFVDRLFLTYEPVLFGQGIPLFSDPMEQWLHLESTTNLSDQTVLREYSLVSAKE